MATKKVARSEKRGALSPSARRVLRLARRYIRAIDKERQRFVGLPGVGEIRPALLTPMTLVDATLGTGCVELVRADLLPGDGAVSKAQGRYRISINEDAPQSLQQFVILHELAHTQLGRDASEYDCDALASELLAECWGRGSKRWRDAVAQYGERFERRGSERYAAAMAREHAQVGAQ